MYILRATFSRAGGSTGTRYSLASVSSHRLVLVRGPTHRPPSAQRELRSHLPMLRRRPMAHSREHLAYTCAAVAAPRATLTGSTHRDVQHEICRGRAPSGVAADHRGTTARIRAHLTPMLQRAFSALLPPSLGRRHEQSLLCKWPLPGRRRCREHERDPTQPHRGSTFDSARFQCDVTARTPTASAASGALREWEHLLNTVREQTATALVHPV